GEPAGGTVGIASAEEETASHPSDEAAEHDSEPMHDASPEWYRTVEFKDASTAVSARAEHRQSSADSPFIDLRIGIHEEEYFTARLSRSSIAHGGDLAMFDPEGAGSHFFGNPRSSICGC